MRARKLVKKCRSHVFSAFIVVSQSHAWWMPCCLGQVEYQIGQVNFVSFFPKGQPHFQSETCYSIYFTWWDHLCLHEILHFSITVFNSCASIYVSHNVCAVTVIWSRNMLRMTFAHTLLCTRLSGDTKLNQLLIFRFSKLWSGSPHQGWIGWLYYEEFSMLLQQRMIRTLVWLFSSHPAYWCELHVGSDLNKN